MATRPVFVPLFEGDRLVREIDLTFQWHSGMALSQRQKNIRALHAAAASQSLTPVLEVSSAGEFELGRRLSAFNLVIKLGERSISFESAYQGSKVFSRGGPYPDLYDVDARTAKKDARLRDSGRIIGFKFLDQEFPSDPPTAFYDWMYICTLYPHADWLGRNLSGFAGFTDIAFNPDRSLNCQARACAMLVSLQRRGLLGLAAESFPSFLKVARVSEARWGAEHGLRG